MMAFMHAVFNPSFNASARPWRRRVTAPAMCWRLPAIVTLNRRLTRRQEKLNRDRRLVLLSDPVTMARLTIRVVRSGSILRG